VDHAVAGNLVEVNRLYVFRLHDTARGRATSLTLDTETRPIELATLTPVATLPPNTAVTWYLSNTGGARWYQVRPDQAFAFPDDSVGSDLRWRAELQSPSPARSPRIEALGIEADVDFDLDGLVDGVDPDDDNDGVNDAGDAFPFDPAASVDTDGDGLPNDYNAGATQEQKDASPLVIDPDDDDDGVADGSDNCPLVANANQADSDGDGLGDVCEPVDQSEICFPIRTANQGTAIICL
jgi:hypothetical protein